MPTISHPGEHNPKPNMQQRCEATDHALHAAYQHLVGAYDAGIAMIAALKALEAFDLEYIVSLPTGHIGTMVELGTEIDQARSDVITARRTLAFAIGGKENV